MTSHAAWNGHARNGKQRRWNGDAARPTLITGGAGFIGTNLAQRLLHNGQAVRIVDNLARPGVAQNLRFLRAVYGTNVQFVEADIRDRAAMQKAVRGTSQVFHFAAQVAVTTSVVDPLADFTTNAMGTLYLLEALRALPEPPPLVFTSTNKVYGSLPDIKLRLNHQRYEPEDAALRDHGVGEDRPLDFHSPYGCSKGAADQYVLDYARTYGLPTVVFRMSCIYGPHQCGNEDQGWIAHCLISAIEDRPITIFGDGKQVRDVLFADDLINALLLAQAHMPSIKGQAFNIGGSPRNTLSLLEFMDMIEDVHGARPLLQFDDWRPGDQRFYVSNTSAFEQATGWQPKVDVRTGVGKLYGWLMATRERSAAPGGVPR